MQEITMIMRNFYWRISMSEEEFLEEFIKNNPFDFKQGIINHCRQLDKLDVYEWVAEDELKIQKLQQENQQLKEELKKYKQIYRENPTLYDEIAPYIINECNLENKLKQYKSVLDEIREYINKNKYFYSGLQHEDLEIGLFEDEINDLLQIIDKVKE